MNRIPEPQLIYRIGHIRPLLSVRRPTSTDIFNAFQKIFRSLFQNYYMYRDTSVSLGSTVHTSGVCCERAVRPSNAVRSQRRSRGPGSGHVVRVGGRRPCRVGQTRDRRQWGSFQAVSPYREMSSGSRSLSLGRPVPIAPS